MTVISMAHGQIPDWALHAVELYGKSAVLDDAADFGKIRGKYVIHHWITGSILYAGAKYLQYRRDLQKAAQQRRR